MEDSNIMLARNAYKEFSYFFGDHLTMCSVCCVHFIIFYLNKMFKLECIFH